MAVAGIIAEFNPFHNGHMHLLSEAKKTADFAVVALGGNFTQRGEPALLPKRLRAEAALSCGADLVLELPLPFSLATAQTFALGGVSVLSSLGLVDTLVFGSESGQTARLQTAAEAVDDARVDLLLRDAVKQGVPYAAAREAAVRTVFGSEVADILHNPNDILGVEYLRAAKQLDAHFKCVAVPRVGAAHDAPTETGVFCSATRLREKVRAGEDVSAFMPSASLEVLQKAIETQKAPSDYRKLDTAVLAFLRTASHENFAGVPDVAEGIENRILSAAKSAQTLWEVFDKAKTKRYTHARIRRVTLGAFLGLQTSFVQTGVPYLRVLGFTEGGKTLLRNARETATKPIVMRASDVQNLSPAVRKIFDLECKSTDIFNLTLPEIQPCGTEMTDNLVRI